MDDSISNIESIVSCPLNETSSSSELPSLDYKIENKKNPLSESQFDCVSLKTYGKRKSVSSDDIFIENDNKIIKLDDTSEEKSDDVIEEGIENNNEGAYQFEDNDGFGKMRESLVFSSIFILKLNLNEIIEDIWNNFDDNEVNFESNCLTNDTILEECNNTFMAKRVLILDEICVDGDEKSIFEAIEGPDEIKIMSPVAAEKTPCDINMKKLSEKPFKTPKIASLIQNDAAFNSPLTPMPPYVAMNTPIIKNELKRFGIKALPKKQAVRKLVEIYEYTHRHKLQKSKSCTDLSENSGKQVKETEGKNDEAAAAAKSILKPKKPTKLKKTISNIDKSSVKVAVECAKEVTTDMSIFENDGDDDDQIPLSQLQTQKQTKLSEEEIKQEIFNFIKNNSELYAKVLNYEPLDFEDFFQKIKNMGKFKMTTKALMHVLDEQCVTFTLKSMRFRSRKK